MFYYVMKVASQRMPVGVQNGHNNGFSLFLNVVNSKGYSGEKNTTFISLKHLCRGGGMTGKQRNKDDRNNLFTMGKHQSANISVRTIRKGINSHEIGDSYTQ